MTNIEKLKVKIDWLTKARNESCRRLNSEPKLYDAALWAENDARGDLADALLAIAPALLAVAEAADKLKLYDYSDNDSDFVRDCSIIEAKLIELERVDLT